MMKKNTKHTQKQQTPSLASFLEYAFTDQQNANVSAEENLRQDNFQGLQLPLLFPAGMPSSLGISHNTFNELPIPEEGFTKDSNPTNQGRFMIDPNEGIPLMISMATSIDPIELLNYLEIRKNEEWTDSHYVESNK
jgi:hypothetical protein